VEPRVCLWIHRVLPVSLETCHALATERIALGRDPALEVAAEDRLAAAAIEDPWPGQMIGATDALDRIARGGAATLDWAIVAALHHAQHCALG